MTTALLYIFRALDQYVFKLIQNRNDRIFFLHSVLMYKLPQLDCLYTLHLLYLLFKVWLLCLTLDPSNITALSMHEHSIVNKQWSC